MNGDTIARLGQHARALAAALAIGATVLSLAPAPAHAESKGGTGSVECVLYDQDGTKTTHPVGALVWDYFAGRFKSCGSDGKWHMERPTQTTVAPKPAGGGVLAP